MYNDDDKLCTAPEPRGKNHVPPGLGLGHSSPASPALRGGGRPELCDVGTMSL